MVNAIDAHQSNPGFMTASCGAQKDTSERSHSAFCESSLRFAAHGKVHGIGNETQVMRARMKFDSPVEVAIGGEDHLRPE